VPTAGGRILKLVEQIHAELGKLVINPNIVHPVGFSQCQ
jgi:hypothetical protein